MLLVPLSADTKQQPLRALAAVAQCEAICISDKEEWYSNSEELQWISPPQCLEEITVWKEGSSCHQLCIDSEACLESCKCVNNILKSYNTGSDIPRSAVKGAQLTQPELFCREDDILRFKWTAPEGFHPVFITEYREERSNFWKIYNKTKAETELLSQLRSNTRYQIRVRALIRDGQLGPTVTSPWTSTLKHKFIPESVEDITVNNMSLVNRTVNALISWTPSWDRTCYYELVFWNRRMDGVPSQIYLSEQLHFELKKLEMGKRYYVAVRATARDHIRESSKKELDLTIPPCLDMMDDPAECPPPTPQGVTVQEQGPGTAGVFDVTVKWNISNPLPGYHLVSITSLIPSVREEGGFALLNNVSGDTTQTMFQGVRSVKRYLVSVTAVSAHGYKSMAALKRCKPFTPDGQAKQPVTSTNMFMSLAYILPVLLVGALVVFVYHRHRNTNQFRPRQLHLKKMEKKNEIYNEAIIGREQVTNDYFDATWEIPEESLLLGKVLGSGAFGIVREGVLQDKDGTWDKVAIKTLPKDYTAEDHRHFWQEINMMKNVGRHPHIVNLVGCCTRSSDLQLVVEFCPLGDLQGYLRKRWAEMSGSDVSSKADLKLKYVELSLDTSGSEYTGNRSMPLEYGKQREKCHKKLTSIDLLSLARQIAIGMEYLASCRVVHRDLAARNVLLTKECTAKIADFGLSRDIYQENVYRKKGKGLLPVKWMALESLLHQIYTTQSDVWSFGILLWEIVTLGGNPYPGISVNRLFSLLKQGHRMERPSNCSAELYDIMSSCWRMKPADRPTFAELHHRLDVLLESSSPQKYLNLNLMTDANILDSIRGD